MGGVVSRHVESCAGEPLRLRRGGAFLCFALAASFYACPASAETLQDALSNAYLVNPLLNAERAKLRATDEDVSRAKAAMRPFVFGSGDVNFDNTQTSVSPSSSGSLETFGTDESLATDGITHPRGYAVQLTQPIFRGFRNLNAIRQAKASVQAGRESLRTIEQTTLLDAVTAYVNVVRDQAVVRLRESNATVLAEQLKATRDRFEVGEVTRTDVAQAEARRSDALSQLAAAQANLKASRASYQQVVGHPPSHLLKPPSIFHLLPSTLDEAMSLGDGEHPLILTTVYREEASLYAVNRIAGELLPEVTLEAQYQKRFELNKILDDQEETRITGRLNVPFYQGGEVAARVRQAKETNNQLKREVESARLSVHADVVSNWGILQSSGSQIAAARASVEANRIALTGVREEEKVGQRTTLDVLNAQLEALASQIDLVTALRDRIVAEYSLYAAIGRLDAQSLGLSVPYYDPIEHYDRVKNKLFGLKPPPPPAPDE